ncbi:TPM domain-containing protein [Pandoraea sp.]|uniref:TPM domain-containing protein n=1 Tax=Pandoraea sp. TaxID=1883445 RepID=UPI00120C7FAB|nr:TPM domain-containing protein [Pandoraea sp.]TAL56485.1 MAG: TPM domain-containing protein [Pandoraea sp.]TAM15304.1 MAG: TPM domain-containing protein [Pandoraea sp.]
MRRRDISRFFRHLGTLHAHARWLFPPRTLDAIEAAIRASEAEHRCEIRFVIEAAMPLREVWYGRTCRQRAQSLFRQLHVGRTEAHTGILIYINVADRDIELIADRAITDTVEPSAWSKVVELLSQGFRQQQYQQSALAALAELHAIAVTHLPARAGAQVNELSDRPLIL